MRPLKTMLPHENRTRRGAGCSFWFRTWIRSAMRLVRRRTSRSSGFAYVSSGRVAAVEDDTAIDVRQRVALSEARLDPVPEQQTGAEPALEHQIGVAHLAGQPPQARVVSALPDRLDLLVDLQPRHLRERRADRR